MKTRTTVQKLLLINLLTYNNRVFEAGIAFAEFYWAGDKDLVKVIIETKAFWDWWRNQFDQQNEVFLNRYRAYRCDEKKLYAEWEACHEPEAVIAYPGQYVIDEALNQMFSGLWAEHHTLTEAEAKKALSCKTK